MNDSTLLTIKEFSAFSGIKQSTLRYYDEIGLFPPALRGENNYRYYTPFQMITLNFISVLIDIGVPLHTIKEMGKNRTPESTLALLTRQEIALDQQLRDLQSAYSILHTFRSNIQAGLSAQPGDICVQELESSRLILGPKNNFENCEIFYEPFMNFCNSANKYSINPRYPVGGLHYNMTEFLDAPGYPNRFFSLDPHGNTKRKAGKYLIAYHRGYYGEFGDLPDQITSYAKANNLTFQGPVYVSYLLDEVSMINQDQYVSQLVVSVK